jgi:hypothetical protein
LANRGQRGQDAACLWRGVFEVVGCAWRVETRIERIEQIEQIERIERIEQIERIERIFSPNPENCTILKILINLRAAARAMEADAPKARRAEGAGADSAAAQRSCGGSPKKI